MVYSLWLRTEQEWVCLWVGFRGCCCGTRRVMLSILNSWWLSRLSLLSFQPVPTLLLSIPMLFTSSVSLCLSSSGSLLLVCSFLRKSESPPLNFPLQPMLAFPGNQKYFGLSLLIVKLYFPFFFFLEIFLTTDLSQPKQSKASKVWMKTVDYIFFLGPHVALKRLFVEYLCRKLSAWKKRLQPLGNHIQ